MATRGTFIIEKDGKFLFKYAHWDNYPERIGPLLVEYFNDFDKAMNSIDDEDIRIINNDGTVERYDDGSKKARSAKILDTVAHESFSYLFKDGYWHVSSYPNRTWEIINLR